MKWSGSKWPVLTRLSHIVHSYEKFLRYKHKHTTEWVTRCIYSTVTHVVYRDLLLAHQCSQCEMPLNKAGGDKRLFSLFKQLDETDFFCFITQMILFLFFAASVTLWRTSPIFSPSLSLAFYDMQSFLCSRYKPWPKLGPLYLLQTLKRLPVLLSRHSKTAVTLCALWRPSSPPNRCKMQLQSFCQFLFHRLVITHLISSRPSISGSPLSWNWVWVQSLILSQCCLTSYILYLYDPLQWLDLSLPWQNMINLREFCKSSLIVGIRKSLTHFRN